MAKSRDKKKLPRQPVLLDKAGCPRFRENKLVRYLLDNGGIDLNHLATKKFPKEDWQQFAQLIGYSVSGYGTLSYADDEVYAAAAQEGEELLKKPLTPPDLSQCQAEIGGAFTLGPGKMRCTRPPQVLVTEKKPGADGQRGSMSLCSECLGVFNKQGLGKTVTVERIAKETK